MIKNAGLIISYLDYHLLSSTFQHNQFDGALMYRTNDVSNFHSPNYKLFKIDPNITEIMVLNNQRFPFNHAIIRKALLASIFNTLNTECYLGSHKAYGIIPYGTGGSIANILPKQLPEISAEEVYKQIPGLKNKKIIITIHQLNDLKNECEAKNLAQTFSKYHIQLKFKYHNNYGTFS